MRTRCADHVTPLYPQKLALTSPTGGGRSVGTVRVRTKATEFFFMVNVGHWIKVADFSLHVVWVLEVRNCFFLRSMNSSLGIPFKYMRSSLVRATLHHDTPKCQGCASASILRAFSDLEWCDTCSYEGILSRAWLQFLWCLSTCELKWSTAACLPLQHST